MSVNELPTEILLLIFKNLPGKDAANCRRVCHRWKDVVDSFKDVDWKVYCKNDHYYVHAAYEKASLSWRELYKSLSLWSKIDSATLTATKFPMKKAQSFQVLNNGVVGVCENHSHDLLSIIWRHSDTIAYYDIETLKEIDRACLGFSFTTYKENKKLICVVDSIGRLCVILKETKERFFVGQLPQYETNRMAGLVLYGDYSLFEEQVYFQTNDNTVKVAKLKQKENGELFIKSYELDGIEFMEETVLAFNYVNNNQLIILTDDFNKGNIYIYEYKDKDLGMASVIDKYDRGMIYELGDFGFDWTDPSILYWMFQTFDKETINVTKLEISSICRVGTTILLGTDRSVINIYVNPYTPYGELKLYDAKPTRTIIKNNISKFISLFREIQQLDAVEIENGHKIIVLNDDHLFVIELLHEDKNKHGKKRVKNTSLEVSRAPKKKPKVKAPVKVVIKGRKGNKNTKASTSRASENSQRRKKAGPEASVSRKKKMPKDSSKSEASIAEEMEPKDMSPSQVSTRHQGKKQSKDTSLETPSKLKKKMLKVSPLDVRTCSPTKKRKLKDSSLLPPNNQNNTKILRSSQGVKQKKTLKVTYQATPKHKYATRATTKI